MRSSNNMRSYILLAMTAVLMLPLASCKYSEHDKTFTYMDEWAIDYPSWFRKSKYVYPGSEFQISNGYRDTYVFVREVVTDSTGTDPQDSLVRALYNSLEDPQLLPDTSWQSGGATFSVQELTGILEDKRMYYLIAFIRVEDRLFQFTGWMFNKKRDLWEADYWDMLKSWRLQ